MTINEYLKEQGIDPLDDKTVNAIDDLIGVSHIGFLKESVMSQAKQVDFNLENTLTKREQFAGFAMMGIVSHYGLKLAVKDIKEDAYAVADEMMDGPDDECYGKASEKN